MGSTQEKVEAAPEAPDTRAKTGVIQHNEEAKADTKPALAHLPDLDFIFILTLCLKYL